MVPDLPGPGEDRIEHGLGEDAGEGVLLTRVIRAEKRAAAREGIFGQVAEFRPGPQAENLGHAVAGELAQDHNDPYVPEEIQLAHEIGGAGGTFPGVGLLAGGAQCTDAVM